MTEIKEWLIQGFLSELIGLLFPTRYTNRINISSPTQGTDPRWEILHFFKSSYDHSQVFIP